MSSGEADVAGGVHAGGEHHRLRRIVAPSGHRARVPDAGYYAKLGRTLEEGCFDMMFFDDRLAMPGIYGGSVAEAVRHGARPVKLDLSIVLGVIAGATRSIGLGATYSTTYYSPFHVARTFATLDHLTGGRAAWNVVTSVNDSEAQNYGVEEDLDHDARYDRADEFLEATTGLWDTWEDDALVLDRAGGVFADPDKVHELDYEGSGSSVRGPLTVPAVPPGPTGAAPGRLVRARAGTSPPGGPSSSSPAIPNIEVARSHYKDQKERIGAGGRDPESVKMLPDGLHRGRGVDTPTPRSVSRCSSTTWSIRMASLTLLSELMNYDFSGLALDAPITDELIESVSGIRGLVQNLRTHIGGDTVTLADLAGHRATLLQGPRFVGTGTDVADQMEEWFDDRRLRRVRDRRHPRPRRLRGRGAPRRPRAPATGRVPRPLHRHHAAREPRASPPRVRRPWLTQPGPLHGLRVIDAATLVAGPMVATILGEFGAEVIKVEQPGVGDPLRTWGDRKDGIGLVWKSVSRNKRCVTLDLRQAEGQELFHQLLDGERRAGRGQPAERAAPLGPRLRVGPCSATRSW